MMRSKRKKLRWKTDNKEVVLIMAVFVKINTQLSKFTINKKTINKIISLILMTNPN